MALQSGSEPGAAGQAAAVDQASAPLELLLSVCAQVRATPHLSALVAAAGGACAAEGGGMTIPRMADAIEPQAPALAAVIRELCATLQHDISLVTPDDFRVAMTTTITAADLPLVRQAEAAPDKQRQKKALPFMMFKPRDK
jgi:hypothetical protein